MLVGLIVKSTKLEVKSRIVEGKLMKMDLEYPTDPYSYFAINLRNHRMVLVKNQSGSPTLRNFESTISILLKQFVRLNFPDKTKKDDIPIPHLNVVAIPNETKIDEELKNVKKINQIQLRFYPLNGDVIDDETIRDSQETLYELNSSSAHIQEGVPRVEPRVRPWDTSWVRG